MEHGSSPWLNQVNGTKYEVPHCEAFSALIIVF